MYLVLKIQCYCLIAILSLRGVNVAGSSHFEQFGAFTYRLKYTKENSKFYCWGDKDVEFHRCNICGCVTYYITTPKCDSRIFAVNMRMAENEVLSAIPVRKINGAAY
ncbi:hypothetical protein ACQ5UA_18465 [Vibrio cholerae]|uniref:hypothetical protein n=1 Tax=Vibrio cholerae TaxID=666 RepID=UPI003D3451AD